ncbi:MAG TPA: serine--tRNA ligase [Firmicutes bacterium]|nr:serine--tRNA ligase [Bacillota bacterium]
MLDLKFVRENPQIVKEAIALKSEPADLDRLLELDRERRRLLQKTEELKQLRNRVSREIGRAGTDQAAVQQKKEEMRRVSTRIKEFDDGLRRFDEEMEEIALRLPNIPDPAVPPGKDEADNKEIRAWGTPPEFSFTPQPHWDLGEALGILDFPRAGKIAGSRFALYCGDGARLERALINFMLDLHTGEHGYREIFPPFLVNSGSMTGTGQLPKFAEDAFKIEGADYYLIPTAEVPVTNLHRDEILDAAQLPLRYVAYSACFRSEAGAHGRDTRGLIRQHQFNKVELVKFVAPEESSQELESLTADAEKVLQLLGLPYRVMLMCSGDLGFAAAKKYDLEVWLPSAGTYREISSCSNFTDFQARRAGIRYRPAPGQKAQFLHTLNGSGVAIGRTVAAILENYQQEDGSVILPEVLRPYFGGRDRLTAP